MLQAQAYLYLIKAGPSFPADLTAKLKVTRTNAYKVLESLEKIGLAIRETRDKKIIFTAEDPIALRSLVAEKRNNVIALEKNVDNAMQQLRKSYSRAQSDTKVNSAKGRAAMVKGYAQQAEQAQPIYFVGSRADVPFMSFETMDGVRIMQGQRTPQRYGFTPDVPEATLNPSVDLRSNLARTWIDEKDYTAPVEWSTNGNELLIQIFDGEGRTITISDRLVAEAFVQLWQLLDRSIRKTPEYPSLPLKARRTI